MCNFCARKQKTSFWPHRRSGFTALSSPTVTQNSLKRSKRQISVDIRGTDFLFVNVPTHFQKASQALKKLHPEVIGLTFLTHLLNHQNQKQCENGEIKQYNQLSHFAACPAIRKTYRTYTVNNKNFTINNFFILVLVLHRAMIYPESLESTKAAA